MNPNKLLRKIYTGEFKLTDFTLEELSSGDRIDINYADSAGILCIDDKDKYGEFVLDFMKYSGEDSNDFVVSTLGNHLSRRSGMKRRISEWCDEIEYYHRFKQEQAARNLAGLEEGLKEIFVEDYISQNPPQLKKTLSRDREFLEKVIGRRIGDKKIRENEDYVFDFKPGYSNPILVKDNEMIIKQRTVSTVLEIAMKDFVDRGGYEIITPEDYRCDEQKVIIGSKNFQAGDVVNLLKAMTYAWNEPWIAMSLPQRAEKVIRIKPVIVPKEEKTVLDSSDSVRAAYVSKMMSTLPPKRLQYVLGNCNGYDWKSRKDGKRSIEVEFVSGGEPYKQRIDITRSSMNTEFSVNTADEEVAKAALDALSQVLHDEINDYNKTRRNRYWE